jgi:Holliday junction resolvase RusA-like endonuclease
MIDNRIILHISPQTGLKLTKGQLTVLYIPEECPVNCGLPRRSNRSTLVTIKTMKEDFPDLYEILGGENYKPRKKKTTLQYGCPHCLSHEGLVRKRRIERMQKYMKDLSWLAKKAKFELPVCGWSLYFYIPIPKAWSAKKRLMFHGQMNTAKPDTTNYVKIFEDAISNKDETMAQMSGVGKFWVDKRYKGEDGKWQTGSGHIEILLNQPVYNPFGVKFIDQAVQKEPVKRKWKRRKKGDPKKRRRKIVPIKIKEDILQ